MVSSYREEVNPGYCDVGYYLEGSKCATCSTKFEKTNRAFKEERRNGLLSSTLQGARRYIQHAVPARLLQQMLGPV